MNDVTSCQLQQQEEMPALQSVTARVVAAIERLKALANGVEGPCPPEETCGEHPEDSFASRVTTIVDTLGSCARSIDSDVQRISDVLQSLGGL